MSEPFVDRKMNTSTKERSEALWNCMHKWSRRLSRKANRSWNVHYNVMSMSCSSYTVILNFSVKWSRILYLVRRVHVQLGYAVYGSLRMSEPFVVNGPGVKSNTEQGYLFICASNTHIDIDTFIVST
jgi:hypothetical protein